MRSIVVMIACSLLALIAAQDDYFNMEKKSHKRHYCGNELRLTLMFLCDSVYKRSSQDMATGDWLMNYVGSDEPQYFPFRSRAKALSTMSNFFRRQNRGVADECCSKPCSINELQSYCGRPGKVACSGIYSLPLTQSGKIFTWGNVQGLEDIRSDPPLQAGGNIGRFMEVATNSWVTNAARTGSEDVYMWGEDESGTKGKSVTITVCTEFQQVFSKVIYSIFLWMSKYFDSYWVTPENSSMLSKKNLLSFIEIAGSLVTLAEDEIYELLLQDENHNILL